MEGPPACQQPSPATASSVPRGRVPRTLKVTCFSLSSQEKAISIWESENFFFDLEPLPGAVEAVKQMANLEK